MAIVYMTEEGYKKLADEIVQATCLRMPSTTQQKRLRECSK